MDTFEKNRAWQASQRLIVSISGDCIRGAFLATRIISNQVWDLVCTQVWDQGKQVGEVRNQVNNQLKIFIKKEIK